MRTEKNKDGTRKVWMTRSEVEQAVEKTDEGEKTVLMELLGKVGLRIGEALNVSYEDVRRTSDGEDWLLEIDQAKDTTGEYNGGKQRDVWLPRNVAIDMLEHIHDEDKDKSEPIITVSSKRTVQKWIEEVRNELAEETGNEQWQYVSSHDFRRSLASHMLHEESVQLLVVKEHFGWQSIDTVRSYLDSPSESVMQREFRDVDF